MKESIELLGLYLVNVLVLALPWAILEIWLEKFKSGWGGEFYNPFWGKKVRDNFVLAYITVYHLVVISVLVGLLISEFFILWHVSESGFWIISVAGVRLVPFMFLPAVLVGVMVTEDFMWCAFNWRFPDALQRLFRGDVKWHVGWINLTPSIKLPRQYFIGMAIAIVLLAWQPFLVRVV